MYLIQTVQTSWRPQLPLPKEPQLTDVQHSNDDEEQRKNAANSSSNNNNPLPISNNDINDIVAEDMERLRKDNNNSTLSGGTQQLTGKQKWSFGRLFRKKKEVETETSSEEDRKAGFVPAQKHARNANGNSNGNGNGNGSSVNIVKPKAKHKANRVGGQTAAVSHQQPQPPPQQVKANTQHIDNEFFLPVETITPTEPYYQNQQQQQQQQPPYLYAAHGLQPQLQHYSRSSNSLDRRAMAVAQQARGAGMLTANAHKSRSAQRLPHGVSGVGPHSSSEEGEMISLNSSTFSKYRSDESINSGGQALQPGQSRRSRAARNERYYKRLSRDGEPSHGQVPVMYAHAPTQRWKTQPVPLSIYQAPQRPAVPVPQEPQRLRNTSSLQNVTPYVQWNQMQQQLQQQKQQQQQQPQPLHQQLSKTTAGLQNTVSDAKRSISYDSHIHLQNISGRMLTKPLPPPPPPRDPLRRVNVSVQSLQNGSSGDLRPMSYAFDQCGVPVLPPTTPPHSTTAQEAHGMGGRCVSDDRIWQSQMPHYQSVHSLNIQPQTTPSNRRYISRAERDANPAKKSLPNGIDFRYIADAMPRSRKPIHMLEQDGRDPLAAPASSGILRTSKSGLPTMAAAAPSASEFWQRLDEGTQRTASRGRESVRAEPIAKPRSISSSRVGELRSYPIPMYSEVQKPKNRAKPPQPALSIDTVDNVVCGSLHIKPGANNGDNYVEMRHKDLNKSQSMPQQYQRSSGGTPTTPNKYDEYVAEKREQHAQAPIFPSSLPNSLPMPPQRKASEPQIYFPRKKPANLEEAINELEAIYKSLGLTEPPEHRERVPTPSDFEKFALAHADEYDDDDSPAGEPDPVRDDVAFRNLQLANLQHKTSERQPPFGIPIGPIVPAPQSDYLHVMPEKLKNKTTGSPDIIKDDLAVRALRKDPPGPKPQFSYPLGALQHKKNRATRTQSANIYNLIHRDAAKPSGGDLYSFMELTRSIDRAGSMSDIHKGEPITDIPATLDLLRKLNAEDKEEQLEQHYNSSNQAKRSHIPFRHPSQGGAICQLPERLTCSTVAEVHKAPVPLPRKSLTPEPHLLGNHHMEDALNRIAQEAQESSIKLSKELQELRKEALITAARPKLNPEEEKLELDLQEIEAVSEAAKRCGEMLLDALPDAHEDATEITPKPPRKLHKEGKLIKAIDQVSEAANAVCEKILKDIVTTEPPSVVAAEAPKPQKAAALARSAKEEPPLVTPQLLKKLDPMNSDNIERIAKRCMRQLSEMAEAESADYDNLAQTTTEPAPTAVACNMPDTKHAAAAAQSQAHPNLISTIAEVHRQPQLPQGSKRQTLDEIDKIMQECEAQARSTKPQSDVSSATPDEQRTTAPSMTSSSGSASAGGSAAAAVNASTTASSFSSSSDCLAKSSSPTNASRRQSSSITSFNPYSSSDYIKSPSSEYHTPSTDPIKTFSTTSYDVQSTNSNSQNHTSGSTAHTTANSTFSYTPSPSPPLNLTPVSARRSHTAERARSSSPSQYNSSEELAMIFGIEEKPKQRHKVQQQITGKRAASIGTQSHDVLALSSSKINTNTTSKTTTTIANTKTNATISAAVNTNPNAATASAATSSTSCALALNAPAQALPATTNATFFVHDLDLDLDVDVDVHVIDEININVDVDVDVDVTTTATSSPTNASTASNCSSHSFKLATIPELLSETEAEEDLKLSSNCSKIYASKVSIVVDKPAMEDEQMVEALAAHAPITQFDSLSSLEETSSNPDSGNVSLADFPLVAHANASLELQTSYNSRYEIRERYINQVSINATPESSSVSPVTNVEAEFPRLPTEEELLESLREEQLTAEEDKIVEHITADIKACEEQMINDMELSRSSSVEKLVDEVSDNVEEVSKQEVEFAMTESKEVTDEGIESAVEIGRAEGCKSLQKEQNCSVEKDTYVTEPVDVTIEELMSEHTEMSTEERDANIERVLQEVLAAPVSGHEQIDYAECDFNDSQLMLLPMRRTSIVYETPQLNLNISELKLNFDNAEDALIDLTIEELYKTTQEDDDAPPPTAKAKAKEPFRTTHDPQVDRAAAAAAAQQRLPRNQTPDKSDEQPCTSAKALSVFGEVRETEVGAGGATANQNLTTLEHVLIACTVGLITPNDLLTLFLVVIGVIIIIAIALS